MTTLRDGTVVDESVNAVNFTPAHKCLSAFGYPRRIESITIHHWGLDGQDFDRVVGYLASANARQSSAHAVIEAGRAASIVSPDDAAWHAGNAYGGATSIGLELRPEATDGDYITAAAYIFMLRGIYGDLPLIPHNHWTQTACPGRWDLTKLDLMSRAEQPQSTETGDTDMKTLTLIEDGSGTIYATEDFVTTWPLPGPQWLTHYRNIEKEGWIRLRRDGKGNDIVKVPAFGISPPPPIKLPKL